MEVALDLLAQPIDVGLERMSGDARIVAPHLVQQHVARDHLVAGPVEIFEDRRLLLGQRRTLPPFSPRPKAWRRTEGVAADGEDRVLGLLVLAQGTRG